MTSSGVSNATMSAPEISADAVKLQSKRYYEYKH
jgi:hypothetical protein